MNQKTALKILGIREGDSLVQAKKAFHHLAKQYHPDRFAKDPALAEARTHQMKQINQAFAFLASLLAKESPEQAPLAGPSLPREKPLEKRTDQPAFFSDILGGLRKGLGSMFQRRSGLGQRHTPNAPGKQKIRPQPFQGQAPRFEKILHRLHPSSPVAVGARTRSLDKNRRAQPYVNFMKHMALKKKMAANIQQQDRQTIGRIEKISPVSRVNPL